MWLSTLPFDVIKIWCDLSLPLWHQFPRMDLLECESNRFGPWVTWQSSKLNVMQVEDKNHWVELEQICRMQMKKCLLSIETGNTELNSSVAPKWFGLTERDKPVCASSTQREQWSSQLTRQIRSHKDLQGIKWKICNELDAGNAEHNRENKRNLDEVFLKRGKNMQETNARTQRNTRELHLELVDDKVTYVRVYWLRRQVRTLDRRSYSSFKLKMGLPIFV